MKLTVYKVVGTVLDDTKTCCEAMRLAMRCDYAFVDVDDLVLYLRGRVDFIPVSYCPYCGKKVEVVRG